MTGRCLSIKARRKGSKDAPPRGSIRLLHLTRLRRAACALLLFAPLANAYSVLSHEAIIDAAWDVALKPILVARFPEASEDDLRKAHAYAYGGAIIQDMGYYPFGSRLFSDLTHYFRGGDFILNELNEAHDLNETSFALGSLAHYAADTIGHPRAVNVAEPMIYPKMRRRFGRVVTYEDNPAYHLKVEFSFDVAEVAENHYAAEGYHDFIGFEVAKPVLERAFEKTYGLPLKAVSSNLDLALGTYRFAVSKLIPEMTKVAWQAKKKDLIKADPGVTKRRFTYALSGASFEKDWGTNYERPGLGARILAFVLRIIPKVGPFRALSFKAPGPNAQKLFMDSFTGTLSEYQQKLARVKSGELPDLPDYNFDTGEPSAFGRYGMADEAVEKLLEKLNEQDFKEADEDLGKTIMAFFGDAVPADAKAAAALQNLKARNNFSGAAGAAKAGQ